MSEPQVRVRISLRAVIASNASEWMRARGFGSPTLVPAEKGLPVLYDYGHVPLTMADNLLCYLDTQAQMMCEGEARSVIESTVRDLTRLVEAAEQ